MTKVIDENEFKNDIEYKFAEEYTEGIKKGIYLAENEDLKSQKSRERYNKFISRIIDKNPKAYSVASFDKLSKSDLFQLFTYIIHNIFGNSELVSEEIVKFMDILSLNNSEEALDSFVLYAKSPTDNTKILVPYVPNLTSTSSIVAMVYAFIHFHTIQNSISFNKKYYYQQILSIYAEKIASKILEDKIIEKDMIKKIETCRLNALYYHYKTKEDEQNFISHYIKMSQDHNMEKLMNVFFKYLKVISESYGIGYLYAENLYKFYEEDSKKTTSKIQDILYSNDSLQSVLNYYGINTDNKEVFEKANQKVRTILH